MKKLIKKLVIELYLPAIFIGMLNTLRHLFFSRRFTIQYPEERLPVPRGYRGEHRLKMAPCAMVAPWAPLKDDQGRIKCVACFMCATACPSKCIYIEAGPSPWPDREKVAVKFEIDLLKCIYCGMCEEACPCDAIELTGTYTIVATSREEKVYDILKLTH